MQQKRKTRHYTEEGLVLKKLIILLVTILSATVLCSCSGCGNESLVSDKELDLEGLANIIESNKKKHPQISQKK